MRPRRTHIPDHHPYSNTLAGDSSPLRLEVAQVAARLVADEGLDYAEAKQRGLREVLGLRSPPRNGQPSNDEVDEALREHLQLHDPEHPARLARLRDIAIDWMHRLERFSPLVTGAVWKGLATEHAIIHLQLFHDNGKEVQYDLINRHIDFEVGGIGHFRGGGDVEAYQFEWQGESVLLSVYDHDDIKGALRSGTAVPERGTLESLIERSRGAAVDAAVGRHDG